MSTSNTDPNGAKHKALEHEEEHHGPILKHPYMLYIVLTAGLFVFLVIMGWIAWTSDLIPHR